MAFPIHRYVDGRPYRATGGRYQDERDLKTTYTDTRGWRRHLAVIDLEANPSTKEFLEKIEREFRIRCYAPRSVKAYSLAIRRFLNWTGIPPQKITREHVREYLDFLVQADAAPNTLSQNLSAIRTAFDKFCLRDITLGLVTPRKRRHLPIVLSRVEVQRLLISLNNEKAKLLVGLMYATGMRVSEVAKVRAMDVDLERNCIVVRKAKGNCDREVMLPEKYKPLLRDMIEGRAKEVFLFQGDRAGKHLSARTIQRMVSQAATLAGINKNVTPHSLRHSFATHCFENGYDIRHIQKVLGHVRLETTTIYVKVSRNEPVRMLRSPIDDFEKSPGKPNDNGSAMPSVGMLRIHRQTGTNPNIVKITLEVIRGRLGKPVFLTGIHATRIGFEFWSVDFPIASSWNTAKRELTLSQRSRIECAEFYLSIQQELAKRL